MPEETIHHIACAVRGRPESRKTVTRAIDLALEHGARLTFVLVIDIEFLGQAAPSMAPAGAVYKRVEEMGEFIMLILADRATRRGVQEVSALVRRGNVQNQLRQWALETDAQVLVMGRPAGRPGSDVFTPEEFEQFIADLEGPGRLRVIKVDPGI